MKTTVFHEFKITQTAKHGEKAWKCDNKNKNYHIITVTNLFTKKSIRFDYWTSIAHPTIETKDDLIDAFESFLGDAYAYFIYNESGFCSEFGYDYREGKRIFRECEKAYDKVEKLIGAGRLVDCYKRVRERIITRDFYYRCMWEYLNVDRETAKTLIADKKHFSILPGNFSIFRFGDYLDKKHNVHIGWSGVRPFLKKNGYSRAALVCVEIFNNGGNIEKDNTVSSSVA